MSIVLSLAIDAVEERNHGTTMLSDAARKGVPDDLGGPNRVRPCPGSVTDIHDRLIAREVAIDRRNGKSIDVMAVDELVVVLQPVVDLRSGEVVRYCAHADWTSPELGAALHDTFIGTTERCGPIDQVTLRSLSLALDVVAIERSFDRWHELRMSINLSPIELLHPDFTENVVRELAIRDLPPEVLQFELTAGVLVDHALEAAGYLARLRSIGVRIALADVGSRGSALADLRDLPIDEIKIGRRFIDAMDFESKDVAIVRAIVALASELAIDVVAEGVERPTQHFVLSNAGCTAAQGPLYGGPVRSDQLPAIVTFPMRTVDGADGPVPLNEVERRAALADARILDTPPEASYEELVAAAAELCGTPVAAISLVDTERQWFKASRGLDISETSREVAFCAHTICGDELMEVTDATMDSRFAHNELVTGVDGIRFYAGVPLTTSEGHNLGALCVIDTVPRTLSADERLGLESLAVHASALIDRRLWENVARRAEHELERLRLERQVLAHGVRAAALHDPLTGLDNMSAIDEALRVALHSPVSEPTSVAICDIDDFTLVNEGLGHDDANRLLVEVAGRLRSTVRSSDAVARRNGGQFAIVISGAEPDVAERIARRIVDDVNGPVVLSGREVNASISVGVVHAVPGSSPGDLLRDADTALARAQAPGGTGFCLFDPSMRVDAINRLSLTADLRNALHNEELFCLFQPEVEAASGRPVMFEALVRWQHPSRGVLPPIEFLPYLLRLSDHNDLFARVLDCSLEAQGQWHRHSGILVPVAVNVAPIQLEDDRIIETISRLLGQHDTDPDSLWIEVVETSLTAPTAVEMLERIHRLGVHLVLDDFGVGYSSMDRLLLLPWDMLKIDRGFVGQIGTSEHAADVIKAIIAMAHALEMKVVGEGVETTLQHDLLRQWGCDIVQGFGISRPIDIHGSQSFLERSVGRV